jgi:OmcA/MtrC family decaheme c-type cytochrome
MNGKMDENGFHNENERGGFFMRTKQWKKVGIIISLLALAVIALSGCSGKDGATGATGPAGPSAGTNAANMSTETMAALNPTVTVDSITISSPPVVKFTIKDAKGNGITSLGFTRLAATDALPTLMNLNFNLAKLVPANAVTGAPSKWVSYLVTTAPTKTTAGVAVPSVPARPTTDTTGTLVDNGNGSYTYTFYRDITKIKDQVAAATFTGDNVLADLGDLTYDPKLTHRLVIRLSGNVRGTGNTISQDNNNTADGKSSGIPAVPLENPKVIIYDFVPATGKTVTSADTQREITTNAACASCHYATPGHRGADVRNCVMCHNDQIKYGRPKVTSALAAGTYSTGTAPAETTVLKKGTTNVFETTTGLAPGSMGVTGTKTVTISTTAKDPLTGADTTSTRYTPEAYVIDGETLGDFPIMIHKLHFGNLLNTAAGRWGGAGLGPQWRGPLLKKTGFGYNLMGYYAFQDMREYPQSVMNCKKCHVGDTAAQQAAAPQANNWKTKPSRVGCGSCHDGINWTTGGGTTLGTVKTLGTTYAGHMGGPAKDDSLCIACHADASIYHITDVSSPLNPEMPKDAAGKSASIFRYEIKEVTVNASNQPVVTFRITEKIGAADAVPITLRPYTKTTESAVPLVDTAAAATYYANIDGKSGLYEGFTGSPYFLVHWSTTGGVDFDNQGSNANRGWAGLPPTSANGQGVYLSDLMTGTGGDIAKATGADGTAGYYIATLKSANWHSTSTSWTNWPNYGRVQYAIPVSFPPPTVAKMRAVQMAGSFNQATLGIPYTKTALVPPTATTAAVSAKGGLGLPAPSVVKYVTGDTARRIVFTWDKCRACHEAGYGNESDGGGHTTPGNMENCVTCHNPMIAGNDLNPTATVGANAKTPFGWNFGPLMHSKHAEANKMGNVNRCEMCHLTGTYSSVPTGALPTTTKTTYDLTTGPSLLTPVTTIQTGKTVNLDSDLIVSPYAAACLSCHSNADAAAHATVNGAVVNKARGSLAAGAGLTPFVSAESCGTCHGVGKSYDVVKIHAAIPAD